MKRFIMVSLEVPENFDGVGSVEIKSPYLVATERSKRTILQTRVKRFL